MRLASRATVDQAAVTPCEKLITLEWVQKHWRPNGRQVKRSFTASKGSWSFISPQALQCRWRGFAHCRIFVRCLEVKHWCQQKSNGKETLRTLTWMSTLVNVRLSIEDDTSDSTKDVDASKPSARPSSARLQNLRDSSTVLRWRNELLIKVIKTTNKKAVLQGVGTLSQCREHWRDNGVKDAKYGLVVEFDDSETMWLPRTHTQSSNWGGSCGGNYL